MLSYSWSESFSELEETTGAAFLPLGLPTGFPVGFLLVSDCLELREAIFVDGYALGEQTTGELPEKTLLPYYA